jgi:hypothetical protein
MRSPNLPIAFVLRMGTGKRLIYRRALGLFLERREFDNEETTVGPLKIKTVRPRPGWGWQGSILALAFAGDCFRMVPSAPASARLTRAPAPRWAKLCRPSRAGKENVFKVFA